MPGVERIGDWDGISLLLGEPVGPLGMTSLRGVIREADLHMHYLLLVLVFSCPVVVLPKSRL